MTDKEKKVKTAVVRTRGKFADEKYMGPEPTVDENATQADLGTAYNWFNYFYTSEDAKNFTLSYLKYIKYDKEIVRKLSKAKAIDLHNIGWNCRLLAQGSSLPDSMWEKIEQRLRSIASTISGDDELVPEQVPVKVISIQDRVNAKASDLIGELAEQLDVFFKEGVVQFDVKKWSIEKGIKPQIATRIAEHFRPQYEEIQAAYEGKDKELEEAYRGWRKPVLRVMAIFIKRIVDHMEESAVAQKELARTTRKPRKRKEKPAKAQVAKLKFKPIDTDFGIKSVSPEGIINAFQLWVFNTKYRKLSVYHADGPNGLLVKGTSITGFNGDSSITKVLRKPGPVIKEVLEGTKPSLRRVMEKIKCKESPANGRINEDCVLLRVVK